MRHLDRRRRICRRSGETPAFAFVFDVACSFVVILREAEDLLLFLQLPLDSYVNAQH
jgi:hypothetical protein